MTDQTKSGRPSEIWLPAANNPLIILSLRTTKQPSGPSGDGCSRGQPSTICYSAPSPPGPAAPALRASSWRRVHLRRGHYGRVASNLPGSRLEGRASENRPERAAQSADKVERFGPGHETVHRLVDHVDPRDPADHERVRWHLLRAQLNDLAHAALEGHGTFNDPLGPHVLAGRGSHPCDLPLVDFGEERERHQVAAPISPYRRQPGDLARPVAWALSLLGPIFGAVAISCGDR